MPHRTNGRRPRAGVLAGACCFVALTITGMNSASAQYLSVSTSSLLFARQLEGEFAGTLWTASKRDQYYPSMVRSQLRELGLAALEFAQDNNESFPVSASDLFSEGYVDDAADFYNVGDLDDAPTTIDNDLPDAVNSAQISFDYVGADATPHNRDDVLFIDNTTANHAGLGRVVVDGDAISRFLPVWPHPFADVRVLLTQNSPTEIWRPDPGVAEPYSFDLSDDAFAEAVVAPHDFRLSAGGSLTDEILSVFQTEGFGESNNYSNYAGAWLVFSSSQLKGPPGPVQPVTIYARISAILVRSQSYPDEFNQVQVTLGWSTFDGSLNDNAFFTRTSDGVVVSGKLVMLRQQTLARGDAEFLPGLNTVMVEAVAQLTVDVPVAEEGGLFVLCAGASSRFVSPESVLGHYLSTELRIGLPTTSMVDQVKVYMPAGYQLSVPDDLGPGDMVLSAVRGDHNMDGQVDDADRVSFEGAYSRPLVSVNHTPAVLAFLQTFDFDGDADIDCADRSVLAEAWSGAGSPAFFAECDVDADNDGVPDGDDDCPSTPNDVVVDQRGCTMGDFDADFDVDLDDFASFLDCTAGPYWSPMPAPPVIIPQCRNAFDYDGDGDADFHDFGRFQAVVGTLND